MKAQLNSSVVLFVGLCARYLTVGVYGIIETVVHWHRTGFRDYWRWRPRPRGGRPKVPVDIRQLVLEQGQHPSLNIWISGKYRANSGGGQTRRP